jgi:hypothetical protein
MRKLRVGSIVARASGNANLDLQSMHFQVRAKYG